MPLKQNAMEYAIHHLDANPHLNAPLRLVLAITYDVGKWVATAFTSLMQIPMDKLSDNDEKLLGHQTYKLLVRIHAKIDTHRHDLASYPPTVCMGAIVSTSAAAQRLGTMPGLGKRDQVWCPPCWMPSSVARHSVRLCASSIGAV
ncbi:hypothetical protein B0H13DRAFT_2550171 [Mycena leptocephala]|nr:hypothetical protein B0H13DRAFT_2550171 [Mycena leptocephala]